MFRITATTVSALLWMILSATGASGDELANAASEFFLAFSKNHRFGGGDTLTVVISSTESEPLDFQVSSLSGEYYSYTLYPPTPFVLSLPSYLTVENEEDRSKGVWVRTADPGHSITVTAMNYEEHTADAFLALPSGPLLQEYSYIIPSMLWNNRSGDNFPSLMLLVGTEDDTTVMITPTEYVTIPYDLRDLTDPRTIIGPGQSYTVTLNKMQTYQLENALDLTGSQVISNKPLSVFAGHECADVPQGITACDHLFEQVPPTNSWGRYFFLVSSDSASRSSPEWYRIVTSKQYTTIAITCYSLQESLHSFSYQAYVASVGGFEQFLVERENYCTVAADKPVLIMQYAYGGSVNDGQGDPFMMMILPTEQYVTNTTIQLWAYDHFTNDITVIVLQQEYPSNVLLDGSLLTSSWDQIYCSEEELCGFALRLPVSVGYHYIQHLNSSVPVAVYVYGFGYYQGYGYPAALSLKNLGVLECVDGGVRLAGGNTDTEGRVEVCLGGQWGTVCNDLWTEEDTDVVCGQLGFLSSGVTSRFYGAGSGPILLDNVECLGVESTILECLYDTHTSDCTHFQDAGVSCLPYTNPTIEILRNPNSDQLFSGYDLTLSCVVSVDSIDIVNQVTVSAVWLKDGVEYNANWDSHITVSPLSKDSDGVYITALRFAPLSTGDAGEYQCTAALTGFTGNRLANATNSTTLVIEDLPQTFVQLQFFGVDNCYDWMASTPDIEEVVTRSIADGVEEQCQCGFSVGNVNQITLQCFSDNLEKVNTVLLVQPTPSQGTSEAVVTVIRRWIDSDPQIRFADTNVTLNIDSDCDIETIQGSVCDPDPPTSSPSTEPPSTNTTTSTGSVTYNETSTDSASAMGSESRGQGAAVAGGVLIAVALVAIVVAVVIVLVILVRYRIIKVGSFNINERMRGLRVLYHKTTSPSRQPAEDKSELVKNDGNGESLEVVVPSADQEEQ